MGPLTLGLNPERGGPDLVRVRGVGLPPADQVYLTEDLQAEAQQQPFVGFLHVQKL